MLHLHAHKNTDQQKADLSQEYFMIVDIDEQGVATIASNRDVSIALNVTTAQSILNLADRNIDNDMSTLIVQGEYDVNVKCILCCDCYFVLQYAWYAY